MSCTPLPGNEVLTHVEPSQCIIRACSPDFEPKNEPPAHTSVADTPSPASRELSAPGCGTGTCCHCWPSQCSAIAEPLKAVDPTAHTSVADITSTESKDPGRSDPESFR